MANQNSAHAGEPAQPGDAGGNADPAPESATGVGTDPEHAGDPAQEPLPAHAQDESVQRIAALEAEVDALRAERQEHREQAMRAAADADNVRKRAERDLENAHKYALERFVNELLPVKDSLELGLAAAADSASLDGLREGTEMTLRLLSGAVQKFGVVEVNPLGEAFDPERHQAMSTRETGEAASGTVVEVVQKGYLLNDRLVRPALVIVAK